MRILVTDPTPTGEPILQVRDVTKLFGDDPNRGLPLLAQGNNREQIREETGLTLGVGNVTFDVYQGEIVVIMGLSGSGKSTLVRCINRLIEPTGGKVYIDGEDVTAMNAEQLRAIRRRKLAMVFQRFALLPHRSVLENASYGLEVMGVDKARRADEARKSLELVGLKGWEDQYPAELSGGMQQRVGLARALAVDPEIILMDEALSALDPLIRKDMQHELIDLQRKLGKTILFITHDLDEAINLGDRIILMKDGRIVQAGTAEEILSNPASDYVARFVEDVDMAKILTAGSVMKKVRDVVRIGDGPRTALRKMKEAGLSTMFAVDSHGRLVGIVRAETASELARTQPGDRSGLVDADVRAVSADLPLLEIVPMMARRRDPVAVTDDDGKLRGVIVVGSLLAGLAEGSTT